MTSTDHVSLTDTKTLAQLLGEGRLPAAQAVRYAIRLAGSLRELHERGTVHGAVNPSNVALVAGGLELLPARHGLAGAITPYTAPEVVQGGAPDMRSDIFGFGAILFELFTGRRAFDGESRAALMASLTKSPTPATGAPALDRVVSSCLNKHPDTRASRVRVILMELKLLSVPARGEFANQPGGDGQGFEALNARIGQIERAVEEIRRHMAHFEHSVAADLVDIEHSMKAQATAIDSSRTAMSQTDDLVERVVEALESLETTVLNRDGGAKRSTPAVN
jgi:Protein tyrosine and serine/threonine kinase